MKTPARPHEAASDFQYPVVIAVKASQGVEGIAADWVLSVPYQPEYRHFQVL